MCWTWKSVRNSKFVDKDINVAVIDLIAYDMKVNRANIAGTLEGKLKVAGNTLYKEGAPIMNGVPCISIEALLAKQQTSSAGRLACASRSCRMHQAVCQYAENDNIAGVCANEHILFPTSRITLAVTACSSCWPHKTPAT